MIEPSQFRTSLWAKIAKLSLMSNSKMVTVRLIFRLINVHEGNKTQEAKKQQSFKRKKPKKVKLQMKTNLPARNLWCGWGSVGSRGVVKCGGRRKYDRERPDGASVRESRAKGTEGWAWAKLRNGQTSQSAQHPWKVHVKPCSQVEPTGLVTL